MRPLPTALAVAFAGNPVEVTMLRSLFLDHPESVGETYLGHARFAASFAFWLLAAGVAAAVHAVLPFAFRTTASTILRDLNARMDHRAVPKGD